MAAFHAAGSNDWIAASATVRDMAAAWKTAGTGEVHKMIQSQVRDALDSLAAAVSARDASPARQAAVDAGQASLYSNCRAAPWPRSTSAQLPTRLSSSETPSPASKS